MTATVETLTELHIDTALGQEDFLRERVQKSQEGVVRWQDELEFIRQNLGADHELFARTEGDDSPGRGGRSVLPGTG